MHEVDLVPVAYRRWLWLRRQAWLFSVSLVAVIVCLVAARIFLDQRMARATGELRELHASEQASASESARLTALRGRERQLAERAGILQSLRSAPPAMELFELVDTALDGRVWFRDWHYEHAAEQTAAQAPAAAGGGQARTAGLGTSSRMQIAGQALDHAALADFVRGLSVQPKVSEVQLLDTQLRHYTQHSVVDFSVAVWLFEARQP